jgi:hypothetical protein
MEIAEGVATGKHEMSACDTPMLFAGGAILPIKQTMIANRTGQNTTIFKSVRIRRSDAVCFAAAKARPTQSAEARIRGE